MNKGNRTVKTEAYNNLDKLMLQWFKQRKSEKIEI